MSGDDDQEAGSPTPATRAELESLLTSRSRPRSEQHLTIGGANEQSVHDRLNAQSENRITSIEQRLDKARRGLESDHTFARLSGHASVDFERSR